MNSVAFLRDSRTVMSAPDRSDFLLVENTHQNREIGIETDTARLNVAKFSGCIFNLISCCPPCMATSLRSTLTQFVMTAKKLRKTKSRRVGFSGDLSILICAVHW